MHLCYLGIVKKLLKLYCYGIKNHRPLFSWRQKHEANAEIIRCNRFLPCQFQLRPRNLDNVKHYKATESRTMLLYFGPYIFRKCLNEAQYLHFLHLHVVMTILSASNCQHLLGVCDVLINNFLSMSVYCFPNR